MGVSVRDAFDPGAVEMAATILRAGGLVAFPTETVYGLGAHALDPAAVARIFAAKGRPASNPLIVHVHDRESAQALARGWPDVAETLAARFWPGPLTLVLEKAHAVPDVVTAGGPTVGVRVPAHPAALGLLRAAGVPIAAPSANRSAEVSPTTATHVAASLGDRVDLILDGGPTTVGVESTVLDVTTRPPRILRPGMVTADELRGVIGPVTEGGTGGENGTLRSPGLMTRHYAPRARVAVVPPAELAAALGSGDGRAGLMTRGPAAPGGYPGAARVIAMPRDAAGYAARLYAALRELDAARVDRIVVEEPPAAPEWAAVRDRLARASAGREG
jgi:L-threonylcarbamoyladenylate synthase